jgi:putative DNA primase/helicase
MILSPILPSQGLVMVHAYRGIGKTLFAQYISYVIACGGAAFDRWSAPHPSKVLYIDGEMPGAALRERFLSIVAGQDKQPNDPDNLQIITPDLQASAMPNLATEAGQKAVEPFLNDVKLVVIDNLSTLARHGRANEEESWMPVQRWVLEQRRRGISVLLVHHDGKNFTQRGTSSKEDILDTVIGLKKPDDYEPEQGARFEVRFEKARGILGDDVKSFECHLVQEGDALAWKTRDIVDAKLDQLESLLDEGLSIRECAAEMGISKSAVQRLKAKLVGRKK